MPSNVNLNFMEIYLSLKSNYTKLHPHHGTWMLWIKDNKTDDEFFEVAIGTILVQNTNWKNVDKAIENLRNRDIFTFEKLLTCDDQTLIDLIRPAGFFNQKQAFLKSLSALFVDLDKTVVNRDLLLKTRGIGKESADSILNFCLRRPIPVIGTYTKRFFTRLSGSDVYLSKKYELIQEEILKSFSLPTAYDLGLFHALVVTHSQNICSKKDPTCSNCFFKDQCAYFISKMNNTITFKKIDDKINPPKTNSK